jgi:cystathionine beta-lyase
LQTSIPGRHLGPVESTYLAWIDASALKLADTAKFFEDAGVGMSPGHTFGSPGWMRLNFACPRSRVEQAVERIRKAVDSLT